MDSRRSVRADPTAPLGLPRGLPLCPGFHGGCPTICRVRPVLLHAVTLAFLARNSFASLAGYSPGRPYQLIHARIAAQTNSSNPHPANTYQSRASCGVTPDAPATLLPA